MERTFCMHGLQVGHGHDQHDGSICYVTSDPNDPLLASSDHRISAFYIESVSALIQFCNSLKVGVGDGRCVARREDE